MNQLNCCTDTTFNFRSLVIPGPQFRTSILSPGEFNAKGSEITGRPSIIPDWIPAVLLFCFLLLAWNHVFNPKRLLQVIRAPFSRRFINQLVREGNLFNERISFTLGILYLLSFSMLLFVIDQRFIGINFTGINASFTYPAICIAILVFSTAKVTLISIIGSVFKTRDITSNYLLNQLIFTIITGPVILTFLVLIIYLKAPFFLYFCLGITSLLFTFRFIRGFLIGMALTKFSYLLLFVYLCTLEILPLLVLLKVILNYAKTAII